MGFSQGATLAHLVSAIARNRDDSASSASKIAERVESHETCLFASLKFAVLVSGFPSRAEAHKPMLSRAAETGEGIPPLAMPSLHVWGEADEVVPPAASRLLASQYICDMRSVLVHERGHIVPTNAVARKAFVDFLSDVATRPPSPSGKL